MYLTIERIAPDELNKQEWSFCLMDYSGEFTIFLNGYSQQVRPTKRHGWKVKFIDAPERRINMTYNRLDSRQCGLTVVEVPLPDDVASEVKAKVVESISVKKWERK
jgi:hypothetical protein